VAAECDERFGDSSGAIATAVEQLYRVFDRYPGLSQMEACPCGCMYSVDQASIRAHPLRELTSDDLDHYVSKAMTTWGDEDDYRHYLPRILELGASSEADDYTFVHIAYSKLNYANWRSWPAEEQAAITSFLTTRWSVGLTHNPPYTFEDAPEFDAAAWLDAVAYVIDTSPLIDTWRRAGTAGTIGHIASFLESNPDLLTTGELGRGNDRRPVSDQPDYAHEMRTWLTALMDDPDFQQQLAAWYQQ